MYSNGKPENQIKTHKQPIYATGGIKCYSTVCILREEKSSLKNMTEITQKRFSILMEGKNILKKNHSAKRIVNLQEILFTFKFSVRCCLNIRCLRFPCLYIQKYI